MTPNVTRQLNATDHAALFQALRAAPPADIFRALALYYDAASALTSDRDKTAQYLLARDGAEAVVSALSELARANQVESEQLLAKLSGSIVAAKARRSA